MAGLISALGPRGRWVIWRIARQSPGGPEAELAGLTDGGDRFGYALAARASGKRPAPGRHGEGDALHRAVSIRNKPLSGLTMKNC